MTLTIIHKEKITSKIHELRGVKVMLDQDLAQLYGVETRRINEQVKRNEDRFRGFCFQLTKTELEKLRSQFATTKRNNMSRSLPFAFTEHGVLMLANVLKSKVAIETSRKIIDIFIELRSQINSNLDLATLKQRLDILEMEKELTCEKIDNISMTQKIDNKLITDKMTKLSQQVYSFSQILNEFQAHNLIIKRPKDGEAQG